MQQRLGSKLASDEEQMKQLLREINELDLRLWKHAQTLVQTRWKYFQQLSSSSINNGDFSTHLPTNSGSAKDAQRSMQCGVVSLPPVLGKDVGLFRPPGHKGPLDTQL